MNKITKSDLEDWMLDYGEDAVVDGPFSLTNEQELMFLDKCNGNKELLKQVVLDGWFDKNRKFEDFWDISVGSTDKSCDIILELFVKFLDEIGITEI